MSALSIKISLNTGAEIPAVGFGTVCNDDSKHLFKDVLKAALLDAKYLQIDTAWYYGTEEMIGETLKELFEEGSVKREDLFITTKVWPSLWNNPEKSLDKSLSDLQLSYVDLFLQHWPVTFKADEDGLPSVPQDENANYLFDNGDYQETFKKMIDIYKNTDKVRAIGVSNYTPEKLEKLIQETGVVPAVNQVELHPHLPQIDIVKYCKSKGIVIEAYSPLGGTGAPNLKIPKVIELADKYKVAPVDILVNYHTKSGRVVLPRSQNIERIKRGFKEVPLTSNELLGLDQYGIDNPERFIKDGWGTGLGFAYW